MLADFIFAWWQSFSDSFAHSTSPLPCLVSAVERMGDQWSNVRRADGNCHAHAVVQRGIVRWCDVQRVQHAVSHHRHGRHLLRCGTGLACKRVVFFYMFLMLFSRHLFFVFWSFPWFLLFIFFNVNFFLYFSRKRAVVIVDAVVWLVDHL